MSKEVSSSPGSEDPEADPWHLCEVSQLAGRSLCPCVVPIVRTSIAPGWAPSSLVEKNTFYLRVMS